jgi:hypothetical protein
MNGKPEVWCDIPECPNGPGEHLFNQTCEAAEYEAEMYGPPHRAVRLADPAPRPAGETEDSQ